MTDTTRGCDGQVRLFDGARTSGAGRTFAEGIKEEEKWRVFVRLCRHCERTRGAQDGRTHQVNVCMFSTVVILDALADTGMTARTIEREERRGRATRLAVESGGEDFIRLEIESGLCAAFFTCFTCVLVPSD